MLRPLMQGMTVMPDAGQTDRNPEPYAPQSAQHSEDHSQVRSRHERARVGRVPRRRDPNSLKITRTVFGENLYTIAFRYSDPKKARDVVQAAVSTFIEQSLGESRSGADTARKFLDEQIKDYDQKLKEAEARVNAFKLKYMGLFPTTGKDFVSSMSAVSDQIKDMRLELRVAEQTRDGVRAPAAGTNAAERLAALAANPGLAPKITVPELDGRIDALKRQIDELLRNYTEQHPDVHRRQAPDCAPRGRTEIARSRRGARPR